MPGTMFQELVCPQARTHRNWYTLPLSFLVHTAVIGILVVVPLIAYDVLPMPRTALEYMNSDFTPVVPSPPPPAPRRDAASPAVGPTSSGVPLVAPDTIGNQSGLIVDQDVATQSVDGLFGGFGMEQNVVEAPPPPPVEPTVPVRPGGDIKPPMRTRYVAPAYPELARSVRKAGVVIIEAIIGIDGKVQNAQILRSTPLLDEAALTAVRQWEYTPTLLNGRPTPVIMTVTVIFDLK